MHSLIISQFMYYLIIHAIYRMQVVNSIIFYFKGMLTAEDPFQFFFYEFIVKMNTAKTGYLFTILASLVSSYVLSLCIHMIPSYSIGTGARIGFLAGFGIAAIRELSPTIFKDRDRVLYYISAGYHIVSLTIMGMIIAAF